MKRYANQPFTLTVEIRNDDGDLTDPSSVAFHYRIGSIPAIMATTVTKTGTGLYSTEVTADIPGNLYGTWTTQGSPVRAIPHNVPVYPASGPNGWII